MTETKTTFNWQDFKERVVRAFISGATAALATIQFNGGFDVGELEHYATTVFVGGALAAITAAKSAIGQGRGSNPKDGSLK